MIFPLDIHSQVTLRDSVISWQHHRFELNDDYGLQSYTTDDADIQQVTFEGKVIENELIRLVLLPEYGGRVISFFYKPTQHEYLYQSECGSPYGIGEGNFYYNWLMVYGGIFPTFPEPEHGKTWLLPWDFSIITESEDLVTLRMEYTDNQSYSGAPGSFNNGVTNITCQIDVSVFKNSAVWDYDVKLINNNNAAVNYEYWTCTTLTPGSESGETESPLSSEIIVPVEQYFAAWSPNAWIGRQNSVYDFSRINYLNEWNDMGIAYANELESSYWGVINHENEEGVFRISDNAETKGMKIWTWGKNNIDNDMFDFSNGGADNYIELWGGTSRAFFEDATLAANQVKSWSESYCATTGMIGINEMNEYAAVNLIWDENESLLTYEINTFQVDQKYALELYMDDLNKVELLREDLSFDPMGHRGSISLANSTFHFSENTVGLNLLNESGQNVLQTSKSISIQNVLGDKQFNSNLNVVDLGNYRLEIQLPKEDRYMIKVIGINGQLIKEQTFEESRYQLRVSNKGLYIIQVEGNHSLFTKKIVVH
ncbi:MAG: T9SS type A sorting domain-containing protein [Ekhidna sp.]